VIELLAERKAEDAAHGQARDELLAQLQLQIQLLPPDVAPKSTVKDEIDAWRLRKMPAASARCCSL
jgi:hypothetical protein